MRNRTTAVALAGGVPGAEADQTDSWDEWHRKYDEEMAKRTE